jgi:hypothetical protein
LALCYCPSFSFYCPCLFLLPVLLLCFIKWVGKYFTLGIVWILNAPKGSCVQRLVPSLWCYWVMVEPLRGRAWWEEVRSLGAWPSRKILELWPSVSVFLTTMRWTGLSAMCCHSDKLPYFATGSKAMSQLIMFWNLQKGKPKQTFPLLKLIISVSWKNVHRNNFISF